MSAPEAGGGGVRLAPGRGFGRAKEQFTGESPPSGNMTCLSFPALRFAKVVLGGSQFLGVRTVVAIPAAKGSVARVFEEEGQLWGFNMPITKHHVGLALVA